MEEFWKDIKGYEGLYQVSNLGRVKSLSRIDARGWNRKEKILKATKTKHGYLQLSLRKNKKERKYLIHRIVAESFLENKYNYSDVNHIDEDKTNNKLSNLEWCNRTYNCNYGTAQQRRVKNTDMKARSEKIDYNNIASKNSKTVYQYTKDFKLVRVWKSAAEANKNGYLDSEISLCCKNINKTHRGFRWSHKEL